VTLWFVKFYVLVFGSHLEGGRGAPFGFLKFRWSTSLQSKIFSRI